MSQCFLKSIYFRRSQCLRNKNRRDNDEVQMGGTGEGNSGNRSSGYCLHGSLSATESFQCLSMCSLPQQDTMTFPEYT